MSQTEQINAYCGQCKKYRPHLREVEPHTSTYRVCVTCGFQSADTVPVSMGEAVRNLIAAERAREGVTG
jgi:Zn ribbon nucleic-acid-binding protein